MSRKFGFDNSKLKGRSPFSRTNKDTGPLGHSDNLTPFPKELGLTRSLPGDDNLLTEEMLLEALEQGLGE